MYNNVHKKKQYYLSKNVLANPQVNFNTQSMGNPVNKLSSSSYMIKKTLNLT